MKIKPLSDRVLIQPNPAEEKTAAGLIIPDTAKEKPLAGKVVAVGPGTSEVKMEVKVGDQVLYGKYAGTEVTVEGETVPHHAPERHFRNHLIISHANKSYSHG